MKSENYLQICKQNYCAFFKKKCYTFGLNNQTKVDFRLIAATNKDLKKAIADREFREDLYFRISTFRLSIAALKNRPGDILPLAANIISKNEKSFVNLTDEAQEKLLTYHWPGNVRT